MEEIKSKLSPMETAIHDILSEFVEMVTNYNGEYLEIEVSKAKIVKAALEEYVSSMEG